MRKITLIIVALDCIVCVHTQNFRLSSVEHKILDREPIHIPADRSGNIYSFRGIKEIEKKTSAGWIGEAEELPSLIGAKIVFMQTGNMGLTQTRTKTIHVYSKNDDGYNCYRIPAIVQSKKGTLLAFAEARKNSCSDTGNIDLVLKRSTDGGKTWSDMIVVWDDGDNVCGNPAPVVDRTTGRIVLLSTWNRGDDHEPKIIDGTSKDTRKVFILYSDDDGLTWSNAKDITSTTKLSNWTWYATGPCHGIQLQSKKYKNRLVIPANHIVNRTKTLHSHVIYSDDSGKTWHLGGVVTRHGGDESSVVELKNGTIMLNMRNYNRDDSKTRAYALSSNGGESWSEMQYTDELIEPVCQGNILNVTKKGKVTNQLIFSNPASIDKREKMTVKYSKNNGGSWDSAYEVYVGPSAYSDMVMLSDKEIGLFFEYGEKDAYEHIGFTIIPLNRLTESDK
jgi:sialidase-1